MNEHQTKHINYSYEDIFGKMNKNKTASNIPKNELFKPFHWNRKLTAHNHPECGEFSCASKNGRVSTKRVFLAQKKTFTKINNRNEKGQKRELCGHWFSATLNAF